MALPYIRKNQKLLIFESREIAAAGDRDSPQQFNHLGIGANMYVFVNVTARVTCNLSVNIMIQDVASEINTAIGSTLNCTGIQLWTMFYAKGSGLVGVPDEFFIRVNHSDATAITYSVGAMVLG